MLYFALLLRPTTWLLFIHMQHLTLVNTLADLLIQHQYYLTTAESCTGGGIAQACTEVAGSSQWFERGFVTYSDKAKQDMLGVSANDLQQYGAVSETVARAMAIGALQHSRAQLAVSVTGIAGPTSDGSATPVGTVWFAWASLNADVVTNCQQFSGDRANVREQSIDYALKGLINYLQNK